MTADKTWHVICLNCQPPTNRVFRLFTSQSYKYLTSFSSLYDEYDASNLFALHYKSICNNTAVQTDRLRKENH